MDRATPGTILQRWACNMSLGLRQQASCSESPLHRLGGGHKESLGHLKTVTWGDRLGVTETAEWLWVSLIYGEVWPGFVHSFRCRQSHTTPQHLVFGVALLHTAASMSQNVPAAAAH